MSPAERRERLIQFASAALPGVLACQGQPYSDPVRVAFEYADEMIRELDRYDARSTQSAEVSA